jgi:hypothetical protein
MVVLANPEALDIAVEALARLVDRTLRENGAPRKPPTAVEICENSEIEDKSLIA